MVMWEYGRVEIWSSIGSAVMLIYAIHLFICIERDREIQYVYTYIYRKRSVAIWAQAILAQEPLRLERFSSEQWPTAI